MGTGGEAFRFELLCGCLCATSILSYLHDVGGGGGGNTSGEPRTSSRQPIFYPCSRRNLGEGPCQYAPSPLLMCYDTQWHSHLRLWSGTQPEGKKRDVHRLRPLQGTLRAPVCATASSHHQEA